MQSVINFITEDKNSLHYCIVSPSFKYSADTTKFTNELREMLSSEMLQVFAVTQLNQIIDLPNDALCVVLTYQRDGFRLLSDFNVRFIYYQDIEIFPFDWLEMFEPNSQAFQMGKTPLRVGNPMKIANNIINACQEPHHVIILRANEEVLYEKSSERVSLPSRKNSKIVQEFIGNIDSAEIMKKSAENVADFINQNATTRQDSKVFLLICSVHVGYNPFLLDKANDFLEFFAKPFGKKHLQWSLVVDDDSAGITDIGETFFASQAYRSPGIYSLTVPSDVKPLINSNLRFRLSKHESFSRLICNTRPFSTGQSHGTEILLPLQDFNHLQFPQI